MAYFGRWVAGALIGLVGIIGLFIASQAASGTWYYIGLGAFVVAVLAIFFLIRRTFDDIDARQH